MLHLRPLPISVRGDQLFATVHNVSLYSFSALPSARLLGLDDSAQRFHKTQTVFNGGNFLVFVFIAVADRSIA